MDCFSIIKNLESFTFSEMFLGFKAFATGATGDNSLSLPGLGVKFSSFLSWRHVVFVWSEVKSCERPTRTSQSKKYNCWNWNRARTLKPSQCKHAVTCWSSTTKKLQGFNLKRNERWCILWHLVVDLSTTWEDWRHVATQGEKRMTRVRGFDDCVEDTLYTIDTYPRAPSSPFHLILEKFGWLSVL